MCEKVSIKFYCYKCDNINCPFSNKLGYIYSMSKQGCLIELSLDDFSKYEYYTNEVIPL